MYQIKNRDLVNCLYKKNMVEMISKVDLNQIFKVKEHTNIKDLN